jgi:hypothetical protein
VGIARAVHFGARVLILDEPTAAPASSSPAWCSSARLRPVMPGRHHHQPQTAPGREPQVRHSDAGVLDERSEVTLEN